MTRPTISSSAPFFIVADVTATLAFYHDMLGFEVTFRGPDPDDEFFGIVRRDGAMLMSSNGCTRHSRRTLHFGCERGVHVTPGRFNVGCERLVQTFPQRPQKRLSNRVVISDRTT